MDIYSQIANLGTQFQPVTAGFQGAMQGLQLRDLMQRRQMMEQQQSQQATLQQLFQQGDPESIKRAASLNPELTAQYLGATGMINPSPEYQISEIGTESGGRTKAYIPKRPGEAPIPIGGEYQTGPLSQVNIEAEGKFGTVPPGYALRKGPEGYEMYKIKGGPAEEQEIQEAEKARGRRAQTERAGATVIQDLQRALDIVESNRLAVGAPSLVTRHIPESDAQAALGMIESALSNVGLDTLQQMRENSPTGGALGQVPIQQQRRLEQVLGSLELHQRPEIVSDNIKRVINIYMDIVHGTPDEIKRAAEKGEIDPETATGLMDRYPLSFDALGRKTRQPPVQELSDDDLRKQLGL